MDSSSGYSAPLPPSLPANGSLPARRLQTQAPVEPPACVQNAMMTKDKKPFTYTPGGIDLSQIKSPRMAKRIARNAQFEGVTNQPKPSPLAQDNQSYTSGNTPAAAPPPASAMGLPVQVFPTGPPPPPPAPPSSSSSNHNVPPPPPPMSSQLSPHSNGRDTRKSPTPQNFEPPPLGCRPEIKIPENPMATLRKVAKPQPKNDFWVEEYRKERSKSPLPGETSQQEESANQQVYHEAPPRTSSPAATKQPTNNYDDESDPRRDPNRIAFQQQRQPPQAPQYQPPAMAQPQPQYQRPAQPSMQQQSNEPSYPPHMDPNRVAFQQQRQQQSYQPQQPQSSQQRETSPVRTPGGYYQQPQRHQPAMASPNVQRVDSPFRAQENPHMQRPSSPTRTPNSPAMQQQQQQQQQQPQQPYYTRPSAQQYQPPQQQPQQYVASPPPQQKPTQVGSLYIAPVPPENLAATPEQPRSAGLQQTPPWLSPRANIKDNPDWVREVNSPPTANRTQTPPVNNYNQPNNGPGLRLQMTQNAAPSNPRERIIPIQLEKTPTPTRTPSTPGFGPQPYSPSNQYGSVSSPGSGYATPNVNVARNPNQFVDQGYNSFATNQYPNQQQQTAQQRVMSPPAQQGGGRIIPIAIERDEGPFSPNSVRGPISPTPMVIQNDPRAVQQPFSPNGTAPNQSKSFRVLQKITDTDAGRESDGEQPGELHGPQYSKQMGEATDQIRRMPLNDPNQQAFVNRGDPRYRGATVPSKTFQKLKSMTDKCADANTQHTMTTDSQSSKTETKNDDCKKWGPIQKQTQRYVQQRPIYQQDDQPQQYIHPSEQQVQEPKIYTGSAIPSRSFKLLQAMTTPENAVETEDTRVVENEPQFCPPCYSVPYPGPRRSFSPHPNSPAWQASQERNRFYKPYSYHYPQFDESQEPDEDFTNGRGDDQDVNVIEGAPDIVITSSPDEDDDHGNDMIAHINGIAPMNPQNCEEDTDMNKLKDTCNEKSEEENEEEENDDEKEPIVNVLSRRLVEMTTPVYDEKESEQVLKTLRSSRNKNRKSAQLVSFSHENSPENSDKSDDESDDLLTNSSSSSDDCPNDKIHSSKEGLHAIKSVTDIKVYDHDNENYQKDHKYTHNYEENEYDYKNMSSHHPFIEYCDEEQTDLPYDPYKTNGDEGIVETDDYADNEDREYHDDVEIRDQLSVIYEEEGSESAEKYQRRRTDSVNSTSSTLSECSTTIANEDVSEEDEDDGSRTEGDDDCFNDDEEENSVTVRLPLRLSFSRSSNDENITTVVVGDSEVRDSRRSSLRNSNEKDSSNNPKTDDEYLNYNNKDNNYDNYDDDRGNDVSVTISLTSRSNSVDRSGFLSKTPSVDHETSTKDWDDSDTESVSISVSLPMKRNKFMTQTLNNDLTNDIHEIKLDWDKRESEDSDPDTQNDTKKDDDTVRDYIPETIAEEENEASEESETDDDQQQKVEKDMGSIQTKRDKDKLEERTHTNKEYSAEVTIDLSPKDSSPRRSTIETYTASSKMLDTLRELRAWNESIVKRATLERELESKKEKPKLLIDMSFEDLPKFENGFWKAQGANQSDDDETDTSSSSESTSSESEELSPCVNGVFSENQQNLKLEPLNPLNESLSFVLEETTRKCEEALKRFDNPDAYHGKDLFPCKRNEDQTKLSVRERIAAFEAPKDMFERSQTPKPFIAEIASNNTIAKREILSRNSSVQRSESEQDEDDSGVTSDMSKPVSENDTDPECFPELRRMSRYQRASTHSRLFKLLQDDINGSEEQPEKKETEEEDDAPPKVVLRSKKKIVHNVSATRRSNPDALKEAETMVQRRERLSLPLKLSNSIDADNPSTSNSPSSPALQNNISEQLVTELIESLLLKKDSRHLRSIPWSKLQAAAKKVLLEDIDIDSLENTSIESTPALTPQDNKKEYQKSYSDYYDTWERSCSPRISSDLSDVGSIPSPTFRSLQNQSPIVFRPVRCPRVLSSKTLNRDLSRLTESRESESPDRYYAPRSSATPERSREYLRATSLSRIGKV